MMSPALISIYNLLSSKCLLEKEEIDIKCEGSKENITIELAGPLLSYLAEMILAIKYVLEQDTPISPLVTAQGSNDIVVHDLETEWMDDITAEDEESGGEESVCDFFQLILTPPKAHDIFL